MNPPKKFAKPTSNSIRISLKRDSRFWVFLAKVYLKLFETVELSAMGDAISLAVRATDALSQKGLVDVVKINTDTVAVEAVNEERKERREVKRPKIVIVLRKTKEFEKVAQTIEVQFE